MVAHPGPLLGGEQIARGGPEVGHRLLPAGHRAVDDVHDGVGPGEDVVEALAAQQVDAQRAADGHGLVPGPPERGHRERPDVPRGAGDCDPHDDLPLDDVVRRPYLGLNGSSISGIGWTA